MAWSVAEADLRQRILDQGGYSASPVDAAGAVTSIRSMINRSIAKLWDTVLNTCIDTIDPEVHPVTTADGTRKYSLATDHYRTFAVEAEMQSGDFVPIPRVRFTELRDQSSSSFYREWLKYSVKGDNIYLTPTPNAAFTVNVYYLPTAPQYTTPPAPAVTVDFINGWDEFVLWDVLVMLKTASDDDQYGLRSERTAALERVIESLARQNREGPLRPRRVRRERRRAVLERYAGNA